MLVLSADRDDPIERHLIAEYRLPSPNALISPEGWIRQRV
jgi:hypothetical protein